ncbi:MULTISPECIES: helix-turn-helix domain-containing protein [Anaerotruncus]|uniref:Helix-turn-helix transcriptional regulator n=1 Tax=Anaerotruncus colihominis TaxID=169435 RepID=A0A845RJY4_9FIRM|nr:MULTISPECIES: helix-turn-helix transcriptional regulator [Anaerotruncus]MCI8491985.1 helix-turn-helix transcriptional regulator [Anaerotruncus sp.]MCR2025052.1 helix-turn-helix domain-containing protein [Anaerotruncus colihominis]NBI78032.1 XRE family transcriptional regulator [Anaerotruncus colihominis]NDO40103.1 helix-turn-helix transcriptional regulator [Anaerotruncus colihominis]
MKLHRMLGKNIRFWREARGFTQEELAFRAQTSSSYISKMELGKENPTITVLERIAKALMVEPCMLLLNTCRLAENAKKKQTCDQQPALTDYQEALDRAPPEVQYAAYTLLEEVCKKDSYGTVKPGSCP